MTQQISDELMDLYKKSTESYTILHKPFDIFFDFQKKLEDVGIKILSPNEVGIVSCNTLSGKRIDLITSTVKAYSHSLDKVGCMYSLLNNVLFKLLKEGHNCISFRRNLSTEFKTRFEDETSFYLCKIRYISGKDICENSFNREIEEIVKNRKPEIFESEEEKLL